VPERTHHDDEFGLFQRRPRYDGIREIEFRLGVEKT
jgi:hypothetical protein